MECSWLGAGIFSVSNSFYFSFCIALNYSFLLFIYQLLFIISEYINKCQAEADDARKTLQENSTATNSKQESPMPESPRSPKLKGKPAKYATRVIFRVASRETEGMRMKLKCALLT